VVVELRGAVLDALSREHQVRRVGHAFHAAGDQDLGALGLQHVVREHHRAHPEPHIFDSVTAPVDCGRPAPSTGLARRRLALAGHQAVAHQHLVDRIAGHAGALDRGLDRDGAELVRGERAEVAEQARRSGCGRRKR
jgi:hypothetical protein